MMAARKGGGTPKTNISSSVSTPHLSAHPRRASSSINRAVSPLTNGNATQTPQQYNFASGPRKMPSAGDIRHNVASAPQSARSHHVVMASQARGVEEHIARLAQRRAAEQSKAQNKDYRSRVRNPSAGRSVPQNATTSGYSSARGAGPVRLLTKNAPLSTTNASLSNRPITAPVTRYNPSNDIHESDQNANKLPHRPNLSSHCSVSSHPVKSYHGSRLPLPSSARQ
ncbi:unnamed protein product [Anisakis simplex]|uniref:Casein kinase II subunit beta n=1 Tax=Anisakis simplex TaxID=6269 RepID=A0A0M3J304_ANISI|nr:unnamed protein product [Anisakis simplex]